MAGASGIRAGRAYVELGVDDKIAAGLKKAQQHLSDFGAAVRSVGLKVMALGGAVTGALSLAANNFATTGDEIGKISERTGLSTRAVQELGFAAKMADLDMADLEKGVRLMQKGLVAASAAGIQSANVFTDLGLSVEKLRNMSPDQQFAAVADKLAAIKDPAAKAALSMEIFGKSGTSLLPLLNQGSKGLAAMRARAQGLGIVMDDAAIKGAGTLDDALKELWVSTKAVGNGLGAAVAPIITKITKQVTEFLGTLIKWINQNGDLIRTVFMVAKWVTIAGAAIVAVGYVITAVGAVLGAIGTIITFIGAAIGVIVSAVTFLATPFGAATVAIVVATAALVKFTGIGAQAMNWLKGTFNELTKWVGGVVQGVQDALEAQNMQLAAEIIWLGLKAAWQKGVYELNKIWEGLKTNFVDGFSTMWAKALKFTEIGVNAIENLLIRLTASFKIASATVGNNKSDYMSSFALWANTIQRDYLAKNEFARKYLGANAQTADQLIGMNTSILGIDKQEYDNKVKLIEKEESAALKALNQVHDETLRVINAEHEARMKDREASEEAANADSAAKLKAAQEELAASLAEAKRQRDLRAAGLPNDPKLQGISAAAQSIVAKFTSTGTFSASSVATFGAGGAALDHIAKATEETARNTRKLLNQGTDGEGLITIGS